MPLPQVAVEVAAPAVAAAHDAHRVDGSSPNLFTTLVGACTAAAATAECVALAAASKPALYARVSFEQHGHVRIEVVSKAAEARTTSKELAFVAGSPPVEKWRAVGYAVGVLASEALRTSETTRTNAGEGPSAGGSDIAPPGEKSAAAEGVDARATNPSSEPKKNTSGNIPQTTPARSEQKEDAGARASATDENANRTGHKWSLGLGGVVGPGLDAARFGGFFRASRSFGAPFATLGVEYSIDPTDARGVSAQRISASVGAGYEIRLNPLLFDLRIELVAEQLAASIDDPVTERLDSKSRWIAAACVGGEVVPVSWGPVGLVAGVEGIFRTNRTDILLGGKTIQVAPVADMLALLGVRLTVR